MAHDWVAELQKRKDAVPGDRFHLGATNFGRDELILPVIKITRTQITCSDGERTERVMIHSGKIVGRILSVAKFIGMRQVDKYRPSNNTEGHVFCDQFCNRCIKQFAAVNCRIEGATMAFLIDEDDYPKEWVYGEDGKPTCTSFVKK
jgi:hypothetical protein